jgi:aminopeptidase-like protein
LYRSLGGLPDAGQLEMAMLWVLNLSDGKHSLLDIAERAKLPFELVQRATESLVENELLVECAEQNLHNREPETISI